MRDTQPAAETIDEYIAAFPPPVQELLQQVRAAINAAAPEADETIKYGIPTFTLSGNLVHFGAYARHIGFYPAPSGVKIFQTELTDYKTAKGSIQFPLNKPLPLDLITRITLFRAEENTEKAAVKVQRSKSSRQL